MAIGIVATISFLFALAGPFETFKVGGFFDRLLYWGVLNSVSVIIAFSIKGFTRKYLSNWSLVANEALTISGMTLLFSPFLWVWTLLMFPGFVGSPFMLLWMAALVLLVSISVCILMHGIPFVLKGGPQATSMETIARLVSRLPSTFDGKIIRLAVDGHIVLVITNVGLFELRMRFTDAVNEVSELEGACVHRSHWIALDQVVSAETVNARPCLLMSNGDKVPVSRKFQPDLEARGIL